jgi:hypothetical protein
MDPDVLKPVESKGKAIDIQIPAGSDLERSQRRSARPAAGQCLLWPAAVRGPRNVLLWRQMIHRDRLPHLLNQLARVRAELAFCGIPFQAQTQKAVETGLAKGSSPGLAGRNRKRRPCWGRVVVSKAVMRAASSSAAGASERLRLGPPRKA